MSDADVRASVVAERSDLVAVLEGLTPQQWDEPTLCTGWRVRELVAHTTMAYRYSTPRVLVELVRSGGSFNRMADRCARRDAATVPAGELLASARDNIAHPWTPPGGGPTGALSHELIHGLDLTVGLGIDRRPPTERVAMVLAGMQPKNVRFFGVDLEGIQLRATDLDWTYGSGPTPLYGPAQDLLLVICGRMLPAGRLEGGPAARFTA